MKLDSYEKWKNSAASLSDELLEKGRAEEAHRLAGKVLLVNPSQVDFRFRILKTLEALKREESLRSETLFLSLLSLRDEKPVDAFLLLSHLQQKFPQDVNLMRKLAALAEAAGQEERAESLYAGIGEYYLGKGLADKAVEAYREIIRQNQDKFEYHQKIAEIFVQKGMVSEAVAEYFILLRRYLDKRMEEKGIALLDKMLVLDPLNREAAMTLGRVYLDANKGGDAARVVRNQVDRRINKGLVDDAMAFSQEWIEELRSRNLRDQAKQEREYLGKALYSHDRKEQAIALFDQVADDELASGNFEKFLDYMQQVVHFHLMRGAVQDSSAGYRKIVMAVAPVDAEKAKAFVEELVKELLQRDRIRELDQSLREMASRFEEQGKGEMAEELLRRLAEIYVSIYKIQEAIKIYKLIVEKGGQDPKVYLSLGELYLKEENWPLALDAYMDAVRIYARGGEIARAEEVFQFAVDKDPNNPSLFSRMGDLYYALGEWDKALDYYRRGLELDPKSRPCVVGTAMAYAKKGMLDEMVALAKRLVTKGVIAEIIEEYKKALSLNPNQADAAMSLGLLYKDLGFTEEAILEFQKASRDQKHFLEAYNQLGLCFKEQGFEDLAIRQYRKALERSGYSDEELTGIRYNLARTYEEVKMHREAHELYSDILVVDIGYKDVSTRIKNLGSAPGAGKVVSLPSDWGTGGKKS